MMKHLLPIQSRAAFLLAAGLMLSAPSIHVARAADASHVIALNGANTAEAEFRVGASGKIAVTFKFADGKVQTLLGAVKADSQKRTVEKDGKKTPELVPMADGWIEFTGAGLKFQYHSRPRLSRYTELQQQGLAKVWDTLPAASSCWVPLEVRADDAGAQLWLDGRYCGRVASDSRLTEVSFKLETDGGVRGERTVASCRALSGRFRNTLALLISPAIHLHASHGGNLRHRAELLRGQRQRLILRHVRLLLGDPLLANPLRGTPHALGWEFQFNQLFESHRGILATDILARREHDLPINPRRVVVVFLNPQNCRLREKNSACIADSNTSLP